MLKPNNVYVLCKWLIVDSMPIESIGYADWIYYNMEVGTKPYVAIEVYTILDDSKNDMLTITGDAFKYMSKDEFELHKKNSRIQAETDILTNSMKPVNESITSIYYTGEKNKPIKVRLTLTQKTNDNESRLTQD